MKLLDKLNKFHEEINLTKRFPNYFTKNVFRGVIVIMVLFTVFVFASNNWNLKFTYIECDQATPCDNPLYTCKGSETIFNSQCLPSDAVPKQFKTMCEAGLCDKKQLSPGELWGNKPNFWASNYNKLCLLLVLLGFAMNHFIYEYKKLGAKK